MKRRPIYSYFWDSDRQRIVEHRGYYFYTDPQVRDGIYLTLLTSEPNNRKTWFTKIPIKCGEVYWNRVWFTKPDIEKAKRKFIEVELKKLEECKSLMDFTIRNITFLSNYDKTQGEVSDDTGRS